MSDKLSSELETLPDLLVGLNVGLLSPGDGVITDRHQASGDRFDPANPQNQIAGQISPFPLSGWLRHGCEKVMHRAGVAACHPGESDANFRREEVYERDLEHGYHAKGSCVPDDGDGDGCLIHELFGGFDGYPGRFIRRPIRFSPIRGRVDVVKGEAEAHYRQLDTQVRSRNPSDDGQTLRHTSREVVGNLEGTWRLTLRETKPEYVGLIVEAVSYLNSHSDEYHLQLGGARNFGAGIVEAQIVNPLYTPGEIRRQFDRGKGPSETMRDKDEQWRSDLRDDFVAALQDRLTDDSGKLAPPITGETDD